MSLDRRVRTYSPGSVSVTFGDVIVSGFAEGTYISIERNGEAFEKVKGADGTVDRINKNAFDFRVTLTLRQTSISNLQLSEIFESDIVNNDGIKPLRIVDNDGTSSFNASQAWIASDPNDEYADELSTREWIFDTGPAEKVTGAGAVSA